MTTPKPKKHPAEEYELMKYLEESGYIELCQEEYGYFDLELHYLSIWRKP